MKRMNTLNQIKNQALVCVDNPKRLKMSGVNELGIFTNICSVRNAVSEARKFVPAVPVNINKTNYSFSFAPIKLESPVPDGCS